MIRLCLIIFLCILGSTVAHSTLDLASHSLKRRSSNSTKGRITCVEPQIGGTVYNLSSTYNDDYQYTGTSADNFLEVEIDLSLARIVPANIATSLKRTWGQFFRIMPYYSFLGALARGSIKKYTSVTLGQSTGDYAILGAVDKTPSGEHEVEFWDKFGRNWGPSWIFYQSAIWLYDPATARLTPRWVNDDYTTFDAHVFYDDTKNVFGMTGNISAFQELHHPVRECNLVFNKL